MTRVFTLEHLIEIWDDTNGGRLEIGPDRDGLDLIEIREKTREGKIVARMTFPIELARLVAIALNSVIENNKKKETDPEEAKRQGYAEMQ